MSGVRRPSGCEVAIRELGGPPGGSRRSPARRRRAARPTPARCRAQAFARAHLRVCERGWPGL